MHNGQPTERLTKVKSIEHLQQLISAQPIQGFILLNFGVRSYKTVSMWAGRFRVENHIDGTKQLLNNEELFKYSLMGEAISKGAFYVEVRR